MYLIYYTRKSYIEGDEEWLTTVSLEAELNKTQFIQNTLPTTTYWKIVGGEVVDKTAEEIQYDLDMLEYNTTKSTLFAGKRYRLEIEAAKLYATVAWPSLAIKALASDTIKTKVEYRAVDENIIEFNIILMDEILPNDKAFILATEGFVLYDVEEINPNNPEF